MPTRRQKSTDKSWYAGGLRFQCTQCGNCCKNHGEYSYVYLSKVELDAIPKFLGITKKEFLAQYCIKEPGSLVSLRMDQPACPFLHADNRCAIYPVRPKQCATWPFWEHNLVPQVWNGPVKECCPGIDKGQLYSADEITRTARETEAWYEV